MTFDWSSSTLGNDGSSVQWAAFYSDCEHEVREVTAGHRVTLTYNLYCAPGVGDLAEHCAVMNVNSLPLYNRIDTALQDPDFMPFGKKKALVVDFYNAGLTRRSRRIAGHILPACLRP